MDNKGTITSRRKKKADIQILNCQQKNTSYPIIIIITIIRHFIIIIMFFTAFRSPKYTLQNQTRDYT